VIYIAQYTEYYGEEIDMEFGDGGGNPTVPPFPGVNLFNVEWQAVPQNFRVSWRIDGGQLGNWYASGCDFYSVEMINMLTNENFGRLIAQDGAWDVVKFTTFDEMTNPGTYRFKIRGYKST
jgi:hypothetical protein